MELNEGQLDAVSAIGKFIDSNEKVFSLIGAPGTGKSFVIGWLEEHYPHINLTATTNQAAKLIGGRTIHNLTGFRIKRVREWAGSLNNDYPILIDEASMLTTYIMEYLMTLPNQIILVGDKNQLVVGNCVDITNFPSYELTQNMRAKSKALVELVKDLSISRETQSIPDFKKHRGEHLTIITDFGIYIEEIKKCKDEHLVLAYRNNIVEKYQELVEEGMTVHKAQGQSVDTVFIDMTDIYSAYAQNKTKYNNPISLDEMLRMILVGMSRARHKIVVFYGSSRAKSCVR
jgi:hypothetical protein